MADRNWKQVVIHEFKAMVGILLYLIFVFCALILYKSLVLGDSSHGTFDLPLIFVKSAVLAKVILIGRMIPFIRVFDHLPLIIPTVYKPCSLLSSRSSSKWWSTPSPVCSAASVLSKAWQNSSTPAKKRSSPASSSSPLPTSPCSSLVRSIEW